MATDTPAGLTTFPGETRSQLNVLPASITLLKPSTETKDNLEEKGKGTMWSTMTPMSSELKRILSSGRQTQHPQALSVLEDHPLQQKEQASSENSYAAALKGILKKEKSEKETTETRKITNPFQPLFRLTIPLPPTQVKKTSSPPPMKMSFTPFDSSPQPLQMNWLDQPPLQQLLQPALDRLSPQPSNLVLKEALSMVQPDQVLKYLTVPPQPGIPHSILSLREHPLTKELVSSLLSTTESLSEFLNKYKQSIDHLLKLASASIAVQQAQERIRSPYARIHDFQNYMKKCKEAEDLGLFRNWSSKDDTWSMDNHGDPSVYDGVVQHPRVRTKRVYNVMKTWLNRDQVQSLKTNSSLQGGSVTSHFSAPIPRAGTSQEGHASSHVLTVRGMNSLNQDIKAPMPIAIGQSLPLSTYPGPGKCTLPYLKLPEYGWYEPIDERLYVMDRRAVRFLVYKDVRLNVSKDFDLSQDFKALYDNMKETWKLKAILKGQAEHLSG